MKEILLKDLPPDNFFIVAGDYSESIYYKIDQKEIVKEFTGRNIVLSIEEKGLVAKKENITVIPIEVDFHKKNMVDEFYIRPAKIVYNQSVKNCLKSELRLIDDYIEEAIQNGKTYVKIEQSFPDEITDYLRKQGYEIDTTYSLFGRKYITTITWDKGVEI